MLSGCEVAAGWPKEKAGFGGSVAGAASDEGLPKVAVWPKAKRDFGLGVALSTFDSAVAGTTLVSPNLNVGAGAGADSVAGALLPNPLNTGVVELDDCPNTGGAVDAWAGWPKLKPFVCGCEPNGVSFDPFSCVLVCPNENGPVLGTLGCCSAGWPKLKPAKPFVVGADGIAVEPNRLFEGRCWESCMLEFSFCAPLPLMLPFRFANGFDVG